MSLLVPDYSSSSEDEAPARVASPSPQPSAPSPARSNAPSAASERLVEATHQPPKKTTKKNKKKPKTTLFLPPEIQKLLESGVAGDSDDEEEDVGDSDSLLAKQKRAAAKRPRPTTATASGGSTASTTLSFLPAPKHHVAEPKRKLAAASTETHADPEGVVDSAPAEQPAAYPTDLLSQQQDSDPQPYAQYYHEQYYQQQHAYAMPAEEQETEPTSKRARHRDRELERMLQSGQFDAVADKIVEISAPAPDAWQAPPVEQLKKGSASELKVKASFWNSSAGTAVASVKPSRLQRQKHQLNQLAFDAKAREFELLDRKGAAIKTKRETHAKYGW